MSSANMNRKFQGFPFSALAGKTNAGDSALLAAHPAKTVPAAFKQLRRFIVNVSSWRKA